MPSRQVKQWHEGHKGKKSQVTTLIIRHSKADPSFQDFLLSVLRASVVKHLHPVLHFFAPPQRGAKSILQLSVFLSQRRKGKDFSES